MCASLFPHPLLYAIIDMKYEVVSYSMLKVSEFICYILIAPLEHHNFIRHEKKLLKTSVLHH